MHVTASDEVGELRRELHRLRAENQRLARLLDVRGPDLAPSPEQPTAGLSPSGVVTMNSPVADKLALYRDLFHARTDVHAICARRAPGPEQLVDVVDLLVKNAGVMATPERTTADGFEL